MDSLDVRGYSCPIPLMKVRDALQQAATLEVLLDDPCARENILKYANSQGFSCTETAVNEIETKILIEKGK